MTAREGQTLEASSPLAAYANLVKLPHTVFALPFALVGVVVASRVATVTLAHVLWVAVAFTAARFAAMGFNRIADRDVDALNPRTAGREIPAGRITVGQARVAVAIASLMFVFAAWQLNPLCLALSPVALAWVLGYSFTKRFTRWAHLVLGAGLGIAPAGGYLAVTGTWSDPWWILPALAVAVMTWVAGFDIFYALQDVEFDRRHGLHSVPSVLGERRAIALTRLLHVATVLALLAAGVGSGAGPIWFAGVAVVALLLAWEHRLVKPGDLTRLDMAFFTMNGIISITFFAFALADRMLA